MEYIDGHKITDITEEARKEYTVMVSKYFFVSTIIHKNFHGDLHSGNVLFIDNGDDDYNNDIPRYQVGIIDFGIVVHFSPNVIDTLYYIFENQKKTEMIPTIVKKYLNNFMHPLNLLDILGKKIADPIVEDLSCIAVNVFTNVERLDQTQFYKIFKRLNNHLTPELIKRYDIKTHDSFIKLEVAVSMVNAILIYITKGDVNNCLKQAFDSLFHSSLFLEDEDSE